VPRSQPPSGRREIVERASSSKPPPCPISGPGAADRDRVCCRPRCLRGRQQSEVSAPRRRRVCRSARRSRIDPDRGFHQPLPGARSDCFASRCEGGRRGCARCSGDRRGSGPATELRVDRCSRCLRRSEGLPDLLHLHQPWTPNLEALGIGRAMHEGRERGCVLFRVARDRCRWSYTIRDGGTSRERRPKRIGGRDCARRRNRRRSGHRRHHHARWLGPYGLLLTEPAEAQPTPMPPAAASRAVGTISASASRPPAEPLAAGVCSRAGHRRRAEAHRLLAARPPPEGRQRLLARSPAICSDDPTTAQGPGCNDCTFNVDPTRTIYRIPMDRPSPWGSSPDAAQGSSWHSL